MNHPGTVTNELAPFCWEGRAWHHLWEDLTELGYGLW